MDIHVTPIYAAVLGLVFTALSFRTLLLRRKIKIGIGYGDQPVLIRAISVHANSAEYVPLALRLIFFLQARTQTILLVHILCVPLLLGRVIHAYGVSQINENYTFRTIGMVLTLGVIISTSLRLMVSFINPATI